MSLVGNSWATKPLGADPPTLRRASRLVRWWGGQASNLRPTDYESAALTD
jgi:hypothetical protein